MDNVKPISLHLLARDNNATLSGLIWVQAVDKDYQLTIARKELNYLTCIPLDQLHISLRSSKLFSALAPIK